VADYRPVFWGQGAFLTPQHLQQQDAFHTATRHYFWERARPYGWGVRKLTIREEGLPAGTVEILECEVVTRDGVLIRAGSQATQPNALVPDRALGDVVRGTTQPASLYLALSRSGGLGAGNGEAPRFEGRGSLPARASLRRDAKPDLYDADAPAADLVFVETVAAIVSSQDDAFQALRQGADLIKFAEAVSVGPGAIKFVPDYIPPVVEVAGSPALMRLLKNLRDLLIAKASNFGALKRQRGIRGSATSAQEVMRVLILRLLSRHVPVLQHILEEGTTHPEPVYMYLREMVGELSALTEDFNFVGARSPADPGLPRYDHEDLRRCFGAAAALIELAVRGLTAGPETGIRLVHDGRLYKAELPDSIFEGEHNRHYLVIGSEVRGDALWARLQKTGKVCTLEDMPRLMQSALFGLKIEPLAVAPEDLPQKGGNLSYFIVDVRHPIWSTMRQRHNIAMICDLDPNQTVITLVTVKPD
jgi:type VI secretion system ImpJ/VasE family protein